MSKCKTVSDTGRRGHTVRVWWTIDYRHNARIEDGELKIYTATAVSGEAHDDNEYRCDQCDITVKCDMEIDYV